MTEMITTSNILFVLGLLGVLFSVYKYFRDPQDKLDKKNVTVDSELKALRVEVANLRDNHIHSLEVKVDAIKENTNELAIKMTQLATIIDERIPKRRR